MPLGSSTQPSAVVKGVVSETPPHLDPDTMQPMSLTNEGRLRVSTVITDNSRVWNGTFASPWGSEFPSAANSRLSFSGEAT